MAGQGAELMQDFADAFGRFVTVLVVLAAVGVVALAAGVVLMLKWAL